MIRTGCIVILIAVTFGLVACGDSPVTKARKMITGSEQKDSEKSVLDKISDGGKTIKAYSKLAANAEKTIDHMKKLAEMEPVSQSSLKSWLPENIDDYKRTYYATGDMAAAGVVSCTSKFTHQDEKSKVVEIEVTDGAGGSIAGMFISGLQRSFDAGLEEETENSYRKVVTRNHTTALEEQNDLTKKASLQFIENDRFHINLNGKNMTADELWMIAKQLHTERLNEL